MSKQQQKLTILAPQPVLGSAGTPQRLSTVDRIVRAVVIEAPKGNTGDMFLADTEARATTTNRHTLVRGTLFVLSGDQYGNLDAQLNLRDVWFNGAKDGDLLVVSYFPIDVEIC